MNKDWCKKIFSGEKKLFKIADVKQVAVPKYDELSIKNLYPKFMEYPKVHLYFPDSYAKGRQPDRDYTFTIFNTLYPKIMKEVIEHALRKRHTFEDEEKQQDAVLLSEEWA